MSTYFDSSTLIAAMVEDERHHTVALSALADVDEGVTSTHALAEAFSVLTSGRLDIQLSAEDALRLLDVNVVSRFQKG